jgi:hypothetical protein
LFRKKVIDLLTLDNEIVEGRASIPGKYMMDFIEEDNKWIEERKTNLYLRPMEEFLKNVDWSNYTHEKMMERYENERKEKAEKMKEKKQELTNIGKRMIEKRQNSAYAKFREQFKDVFDKVNF